MTFLFLALVMFEGPVKVESVVSLEALPDDSDYFLQLPTSFDVDSNGNYYVLDAEAGTVFSWDKQGAFRQTIGSPGGGPGEFQFGGRGPASGFLSAAGKHLVVYSPRNNKLQLFDNSGAFQKEIALGGGRGRVQYFAETTDNHFVLHKRTRLDEGFFSIIQLLGPDGKLVKTYRKLEDNTFNISGSRGNRRFTLRPFNPTLISSYNRATGELMVGFSGEPHFDVIGKDGKSRKIKVTLPRKDVDKSIKDEYLLRFANSRRVPTFEWPDKMSFYTHLISLGDKGYLVYNESSHYRNLEGVRLDKNGVSKGKFNMKCGVGGGLYAAQGRTLAVTTDEDDEFVLKEVVFE